jgi:hypothetical protein
MGILDDVASDAGIELEPPHALGLVSADDANRLLNVCLARSVRVFDAEAFVVDADGIRSTGEILDLHSLRSVFESVARSRRFVATLGSDAVRFSFVLLEPDVDDPGEGQ